MVAALGFLGAGIGVFVGRGIGVFECRHWCFCGSRHRGLPSSVRRRHSFFLGENLELRKKNGKTLMRRRDSRDGQASKFSENAARSYPARVRGCRLRASRRRRYDAIQDDQPPPPRVRARPRCAGPRRPRRPRERDRRTDRRNLEFARAAVRLLRDTDGNTVQRTVPPTAPPPLTTTRTGMPALEQQQQQARTRGGDNESRRSCKSCDVRQQKTWKRQTTEGQAG